MGGRLPLPSIGLCLDSCCVCSQAPEGASGNSVGADQTEEVPVLPRGNKYSGRCWCISITTFYIEFRKCPRRREENAEAGARKWTAYFLLQWAGADRRKVKVKFTHSCPTL